MAITEMRLVNITASNQQLDAVLKKFIELDDFHPELASKLAGSVEGLTTLYYENPYLKMLNRIKEVEEEMGLVIETQEVDVDKCDLERINRYVERTHDKFDEIDNHVKEVEIRMKGYQDALQEIGYIENLNVSLDDLFSCKYVVTRFGRLPLDSVQKLQFYNNRPFIWNSFSVDNNYSWGLYLATKEYEREVDNIFTSLYFERVLIPDFVHGTPEKAKENLLLEIEKCEADLKEASYQRQRLRDRVRDRYSMFTSILEHVSKMFEARKYVLGLGGRFEITGFTPANQVDALKAKFAMIDGVSIEVLPATTDKRLTPPTKLKNGWFSRPFGMFVEMYGVPQYEDIDPTPFVAFTYTLLFAIMFGDVGQGLVLALVGYLAYKFKKMDLGAVGVRIGLASAAVGFLYGSVFGNETLLDPLYHAIGLSGKPIHTMDPGFTMTLLISAIAIGAVLILSTMLLNMYVLYKRKNIPELLFSNNGIAGFIFFGFVLVAAALSFVTEINPVNPITLILFVGIPLVLMFLKEPLERKFHKEAMFPDGFGGFFTEGFFELFEIILSYITNTMSYMRVAGFVLAHAGMMLVVSSLMEMAGKGSLLVLILGNIFVMALEGLIVGIQVLRLEFYEMFSRYYTGDGVLFRRLNETL